MDKFLPCTRASQRVKIFTLTCVLFTIFETRLQLELEKKFTYFAEVMATQYQKKFFLKPLKCSCTPDLILKRKFNFFRI